MQQTLLDLKIIIQKLPSITNLWVRSHSLDNDPTKNLREITREILQVHTSFTQVHASITQAHTSFHVKFPAHYLQENICEIPEDFVGFYKFPHILWDFTNVSCKYMREFIKSHKILWGFTYVFLNLVGFPRYLWEISFSRFSLSIPQILCDFI